MISKKRIFILYEFFPPATQSGGITRSIFNLSRFLTDYFEVYVFTGCYDLNNKEPLQVQTDTWITLQEDLYVFYSKKKRNLRIRKELQNIHPQVVYINGLFTPQFSLYALLNKNALSKQTKWVIAPRGMLQTGALAVKPLKKKVYLNFMKNLNLFNGVSWHGTEQQERDDIEKFGIHPKLISMASNIPTMDGTPNFALPKKRNEISLVFLALVSPVKNLDSLIKSLMGIPSDLLVRLDIYGPIKDSNYWDQCVKLIDLLPSNVEVVYKGQILPEQSHETLCKYHLFTLLTKGENFGHAIFESLYAGTPVLISDKTPWRNLEKSHAGWDMDLSKLDQISRIIQKVAKWGNEDYHSWRIGARSVAEDFLKRTDFESQYKRLFDIEVK